MNLDYGLTGRGAGARKDDQLSSASTLPSRTHAQAAGRGTASPPRRASVLTQQSQSSRVHRVSVIRPGVSSAVDDASDTFGGDDENDGETKGPRGIEHVGSLRRENQRLLRNNNSMHAELLRMVEVAEAEKAEAARKNRQLQEEKDTLRFLLLQHTHEQKKTERQMVQLQQRLDRALQKKFAVPHAAVDISAPVDLPDDDEAVLPVPAAPQGAERTIQMACDARIAQCEAELAHSRLREEEAAATCRSLEASVKWRDEELSRLGQLVSEERNWDRLAAVNRIEELEAEVQKLTAHLDFVNAERSSLKDELGRRDGWKVASVGAAEVSPGPAAAPGPSAAPSAAVPASTATKAGGGSAPAAGAAASAASSTAVADELRQLRSRYRLVVKQAEGLRTELEASQERLSHANNRIQQQSAEIRRLSRATGRSQTQRGSRGAGAASASSGASEGLHGQAEDEEDDAEERNDDDDEDAREENPRPRERNTTSAGAARAAGGNERTREQPAPARRDDGDDDDDDNGAGASETRASGAAGSGPAGGSSDLREAVVQVAEVVSGQFGAIMGQMDEAQDRFVARLDEMTHRVEGAEARVRLAEARAAVASEENRRLADLCEDLRRAATSSPSTSAPGSRAAAGGGRRAAAPEAPAPAQRDLEAETMRGALARAEEHAELEAERAQRAAEEATALRVQLEEMRGESEAVAALLQSATDRIKEYRAELDGLDSRSATVEEENRQLREKMAQLESAKGAQSRPSAAPRSAAALPGGPDGREVDELKALCRQIARTRDETQARLNECLADRDRVGAALGIAQAEAASLARQCEHEGRKIEAQQQALEALDRERDALQLELDEECSRRAAAVRDLDDSRRAFANLAEELEDLRAAAAGQAAISSDRGREVASLVDQLDRAAGRTGELERQVSVQQQELAALVQDLENMVQENQHLNGDLSRAAAARDARTSELETVSSRLLYLEEVLKATERERDDLLATYRLACDEIDRLKAASAEMERSASLGRSQASARQQELARLELHARAQEREVESLKTDLREYEGQHQDLARALAAARAEVSAVRAENDDLSRGAQSARGFAHGLEEQRAALQSRVVAAEEHVADLERRLDRCEELRRGAEEAVTLERQRSRGLEQLLGEARLAIATRPGAPAPVVSPLAAAAPAGAGGAVASSGPGSGSGATEHGGLVAALRRAEQVADNLRAQLQDEAVIRSEQELEISRLLRALSAYASEHEGTADEAEEPAQVPRAGGVGASSASAAGGASADWFRDSSGGGEGDEPEDGAERLGPDEAEAVAELQGPSELEDDEI